MKRIIAISLAGLMLLSTLGLNMATHYCGGQAVISTLTFGHEHLDCGMGEAKLDCSLQSSLPSFQKQTCCENNYATLHIEDEFKSGSQLHQIQSPFVLVEISFSDDLFATAAASPQKYSKYLPPLIERDKQVFLQTFRI